MTYSRRTRGLRERLLSSTATRASMDSLAWAVEGRLAGIGGWSFGSGAPVNCRSQVRRYSASRLRAAVNLRSYGVRIGLAIEAAGCLDSIRCLTSSWSLFVYSPQARQNPLAFGIPMHVPQRDYFYLGRSLIHNAL